MTFKQALAFVKKSGLVLESARGSAPSLAEAVAGGPIRGSWWSHPKGNAIFLCSRAIRESPDVLVCRLLDGKVTYVHRRLWPAVLRLAEELTPARLAAIQEVHTPAGKHKVTTIPFPQWVGRDVIRAAKQLSRDQAARLLRLAPNDPVGVAESSRGVSAANASGPPPVKRAGSERQDREPARRVRARMRPPEGSAAPPPESKPPKQSPLSGERGLGGEGHEATSRASRRAGE